ncbi:serine/arginine-rich splicing factor 1-like [Clavelina lepadiformis]|uniref:serine/arginine-rich splicing factor 1-like n=1 Tax=Clavelina lepadiformis TaxID=159417 RepID=UPI0040439106
MSRAGSTDCRIYVGNLPPDVRERDLDDLFYKYGAIRNIDLKNRRGTPYAFIDFEDCRDADDAVRGRNDYKFEGLRLKVERPRASAGRTSNNYVRGKPGPPSKRTEYRVVVEGLPSSGSWQDLKDHMREAGDVCYADVYRDGSGVVEFMNHDDMKFAVRHLDQTRFKSHEGETARITVKMERRSSSPDRSRSRSRSRSHSAGPRRRPSFSPKRSCSRSPNRAYRRYSRSRS